MNSRMLFGPNPLSCAMGPSPKDQLAVLNRMEDFLKSFSLFDKDGGLKTDELPWQHGILCSIRATKKLHSDLVVNGEFSFLMTSRLNQDCLENYFSRVRGKNYNLPIPFGTQSCLNDPKAGSK